jgi:arsenate reductase
VKTVLFVCVHNAGRSQMAEALFNQLAGQRGIPARAESAGTEPAGQVHPEVVDVMRERGIDLSRRRPRRLAEAHVRRAWRVITMGCAPDAGAGLGAARSAGAAAGGGPGAA